MRSVPEAASSTSWPLAGVGVARVSVTGSSPVVDLKCGSCRAGGTRTPNHRFWRPGLYQLSYDPSRCPHLSAPTWSPVCGRADAVAGRPPRSRVYARADGEVEPSVTGTRAAAGFCDDWAMSCEFRDPLPPVPPHRLDRRVRHAGRRCQGQGPEGGRPAGHRLRGRRARLPDARLHRRGCGRRLPRPAQPPLHPDARAARAARGHRGQDGPRLGLHGDRRARCWSPTAASRRSTTRSPALLDPGDEVAAARALLDDVPGVDPAGGRSPRRGAHRRGQRLPGQRRAARGRAHQPHQGCWSSSPPPTRRGPSTPPRRSRRSGAGRPSTACGS